MRFGPIAREGSRDLVQQRAQLMGIARAPIGKSLVTPVGTVEVALRHEEADLIGPQLDCAVVMPIVVFVSAAEA
jgi:hypothetical protein